MASSPSIPPNVAALFARRAIAPARLEPKPAAEKRLALAAPSKEPQRYKRRGSILDILV